MNILEKLAQVESQLKLNNFMDDWIVKSCIDLIASRHLIYLSNKDIINNEDVVLINDISSCTTVLYGKNLQEVCSQMYNFARENSKGACTTKRFFVESSLYNENFDPGNKVTFLGARIISSNIPLNGMIIGINESKFQYTEPKLLITLGKINGK